MKELFKFERKTRTSAARLFTALAPILLIFQTTWTSTAHCTVTGIVTDFRGNKIPAATIHFVNGQNDYSIQTTETGSYSIELPAGSFGARVVKAPFCPEERANFLILNGHRVEIDFELFVCGNIDTEAVNSGQLSELDWDRLRKKAVGYDFEELPGPASSALKALVRFGHRKGGKLVTYTGFTQQGVYVRPVLTFNLCTLRADSIVYDAATRTITAQANVMWQDGQTTKIGKYFQVVLEGSPRVSRLDP